MTDDEVMALITSSLQDIFGTHYPKPKAFFPTSTHGAYLSGVHAAEEILGLTAIIHFIVYTESVCNLEASKMNKQKTKKSKWFSLLIGGVSFMVLATSAAQAKELFNEYQASSSGFVVAQNDATNSKMIMKKAMMQTQQQRQKLISQNKNNPIFKGTAGKKRFTVTLQPLSNVANTL